MLELTSDPVKAPASRRAEFTTVVSVLRLCPEWVSRSGESRALAKSVGRFSSRDLPDLPASLGFPIFRNRAPMGFGRSGLDQELHDFKGFHFVYEKHFFVNGSAYQKSSWVLANPQPPEPPEPHFEFSPGPASFPWSQLNAAALLGPARDTGAAPLVRVGRPPRGFEPATGSVAHADHCCKFGPPLLVLVLLWSAVRLLWIGIVLLWRLLLINGVCCAPALFFVALAA